MKTPDKIKKGLKWCVNDSFGCSERCAYFNPSSNGVDCATELHTDALAYIQQLEADKAELLEKIKQLELERDALKLDLKACVTRNKRVCHLCKNRNKPICNMCSGCDVFEWRGVQEG